MSLFSSSTQLTPLAPLTPLTGETYQVPSSTPLYIFMFFFFLILGGITMFYLSRLSQKGIDEASFGPDERALATRG